MNLHFPRRRKTRAAAAHPGITVERLLNEKKAALTAQRDQHDARILALVEEISHRYYAASAVYEMHRGTRRDDRRQYAMGEMSACVDILSHVTGMDTITLGFRMERGLPASKDSSWGTRIVREPGRPEWVAVDHDGITEDVEDHLNRLRYAGLVATGHSLAAHYAENYLNTDQKAVTA